MSDASNTFERHHINPEGLFRHPAYDRATTIQGSSKLIFIAGLTAADEKYRAIAPGDYRAQYIAINEQLDMVLKESGAGWEDVVFRRIFVLDIPSFQKVIVDPSLTVPWKPGFAPPSTMIGVTRLSNPDFLIEIDLLAAVPA